MYFFPLSSLPRLSYMLFAYIYYYESYKILLSFHFPHCSSYHMCYYGVVLIPYLVQRPLIIGSFFILVSLFAMIFDVGEMLLQNVTARFAMVRVMITSFYNCWCKVQVPKNYKFYIEFLPLTLKLKIRK